MIRSPAPCCVLLLASALFALTGCITTTDNPSPVEESPSEAASFNVQLGANYLRQGNLELAKEKIEKALEQDPELPLAHTYAGLLFDRLGEAERAEGHYRTSLKLQPDDSVTLNLFGAYLCRQTMAEQAERYFLAATRDPLYRTPEVPYTNAGVCLAGAGLLERAESYFRRALDANGRYGDALWQMARLSDQRGRSLQARAFFQRYAEVNSLNAQALWLGVRIERSLGDKSSAQRYADRLLSEFPDSVEARQLLDTMENT
ncbi:MAG: type IV pilus biogenesis/stability protein PilW [Pseudomonadota bacterium]